ncbi:MAG: DNA polymerase III subunit beta [Chloroflexi bacterium]|nr:DNA polymerase III subunit beta [Chloroflexota bacterium]
MRVSCLQENLARGLSIVGKAVASRSTLPVLSNVLLAAEQSRLRLSATNLEIGIHCWIGAKVEDEGAITVPARVLTDYVNSLPPDKVSMDMDVRSQTLSLRCARFDARMRGIDAAEFPPIPTNGDGRHISLDPRLFRSMVEQVAFAAASDDSRPVLTGVYTHLEPGEGGAKLTLAAADGFRLAVREAVVDAQLDEGITIIIPARSLSELSRIIGALSEEDLAQPLEVSITPARNQVLFQLPNVQVVSQLIDLTFPDYRAIIPKTYATRTVVDTQAFLHAVKQAAIFARSAANVVRFQAVPGTDLAPGRLTVTATSAELGDNVGEMDVAVEGNQIEIAFDARYVVDVLGAVNAPQVVLETTTASSPGVIRPAGESGFLAVVMPIYLR